ncbi:centromere/kinetochore protein-like protein zw10 [Xylogone sp. PMI_703]|nr:centromere/kinetochore protein-like protein zw10 [Xylogone sp. PMI_703]
MTSMEVQNQLGRILIEFSRNGSFPEDEAVSATVVQGSALPGALEALSAAKADLETEIRQLSRDSAAEVDSWIVNAKSLQDDIDKSRRLASEIARQAEADEENIEAMRERETYVEFLMKENLFNDQLRETLEAIKVANDSFDAAEKLSYENRIVDALHSLENAWKSSEKIPLEKTTRAVRLLDARYSQLRDSLQTQLLTVWNSLVSIDKEQKCLTINQSLGSQNTDINEALIGLMTYSQLDSEVKKLWDDFDIALVRPRTEFNEGHLSSVQIQGNKIISGSEETDYSIKSLFADLEQIIRFIATNLPYEFVKLLSSTMMPVLSNRIKDTWLDTAVPASLDDMADYQKTLTHVNNFAAVLTELKWSGADLFQEWVSNAPRVWLNNRRETALDFIRNQLSLGIGATTKVDRVEKRLVSSNESKDPSSKENGNGITAANQDNWDDAWGSDEETEPVSDADPPVAAGDEEKTTHNPDSDVQNVDIDEADAWGWGDDDDTEAEPESKVDEVQAESKSNNINSQTTSTTTREVTLTESYTISAMPRPVLQTVTSILDDAASLKSQSNESNPVAPAAVGLFNLPVLVLAMYRAVSPYYYGRDQCGNMYLYNDSMWLANELKEYNATWTERTNLSASLVKLEADIKALDSFSKRAYTNELNDQRTVLKDLLGGAQNFLHQDGLAPEELQSGVDSVVEHIKRLADLWKPILSRSAWASSIGALLNTIATKIILDIFELSDLSADQAYRTAQLISRVTELDSLFLPENKNEPQIPTTSQYADKWLKLHFLNEVLQSNLKDIHFLWFESDLSLYFTVEEVVDLISLSFENNATVRDTVRQIRENPTPKGVVAE